MDNIERITCAFQAHATACKQVISDLSVKVFINELEEFTSVRLTFIHKGEEMHCIVKDIPNELLVDGIEPILEAIRHSSFP